MSRGRDPAEIDIAVLTDIVLTDDFEAAMDMLRAALSDHGGRRILAWRCSSITA